MVLYVRSFYLSSVAEIEQKVSGSCKVGLKYIPPQFFPLYAFLSKSNIIFSNGL